MNSLEALQYPTFQQGHVMKKLLPPKGFSAPLSSNLIFFSTWTKTRILDSKKQKLPIGPTTETHRGPELTLGPCGTHLSEGSDTELKQWQNGPGVTFDLCTKL